MKTNYLIDTNVLIDAQMKRLPANGLAFLSKTIDENFTVSFITYIEFLGYKSITEASGLFIKLAKVVEINKMVIDACIKLRKTQRIKLPDSIIAATAIVHNYTLISNNESDFVNIEGLNLLNLYSL
jgi:predicted nucleic acid-binding protein